MYKCDRHTDGLTDRWTDTAWWLRPRLHSIARQKPVTCFPTSLLFLWVYKSSCHGADHYFWDTSRHVDPWRQSACLCALKSLLITLLIVDRIESFLLLLSYLWICCVQVQFSSERPVQIVLDNDEEWEADYQQARVGHWEVLARDRTRFMKRIEQAEQTISWIFMPQHRSKIFSQLHE